MPYQQSKLDEKKTAFTECRRNIFSNSIGLNARPLFVSLSI